MAALQQRTTDLIRAHEDQVLASWIADLSRTAQAQDARVTMRELEQ
ncbi:polyvinylalcohol dehydrogenase, partial [Kosakonia sp. H7A]